MRCSNCGKNVPFGGRQCPYCHADKSRDQQRLLLLVVLGIVGGGVGWLVRGLDTAVIGLLVGVVAGLIMATRIK